MKLALWHKEFFLSNNSGAPISLKIKSKFQHLFNQLMFLLREILILMNLFTLCFINQYPNISFNFELYDDIGCHK